MAEQGSWASTKIIPSIIFILAPVIAIGLLITWSLRMQGIRRRYIAELARRGYHASTNRLDPGDVPIMHEVWIGDDWWDHGREGSLPGEQSSVPLKVERHINGCYGWESLLPVSLTRASESPSLYQLGVIVRMPSINPHKDISHIAMSDMDMQVGALLIPEARSTLS